MLENQVEPLVTVLIPAYNAEEFIERAVLSIIEQTYKNLEILIINDGSIDNTLKIIQNLSKADNRIKILNNKKNKGLLYSLNLGLKIAKGEFLARMDADDISLSFRIEKQIHFFLKNPDVAICSSSRIIFKNGQRTIFNKYPNRNFFIKKFLMFQNPIAHPTVMFNLFYFRKYNLKYKSFYAEDYDLWVSTIKNNKIYNLKDPLIIYNEHENQYSILKVKEQAIKTRLIASSFRNDFSVLNIIFSYLIFVYIKLLLTLKK